MERKFLCEIVINGASDRIEELTIEEIQEIDNFIVKLLNKRNMEV